MKDQETNKTPVGKVDEAVGEFLSGLKSQAKKLSVADVMRLLDLRKELAHDEIREVKVRWVESNPAPFVINR